MNRLLWVAGGRHYTDLDQIKRALLPYHDWTLITGAATGADHIAEMVWKDMERPYIGVPARWAAYGRAAGPMRNDMIAERWKPTRLLAFPGGRGTEDAIRRAREAAARALHAFECVDGCERSINAIWHYWALRVLVVARRAERGGE